MIKFLVIWASLGGSWHTMTVTPVAADKCEARREVALHDARGVASGIMAMCTTSQRAQMSTELASCFPVGREEDGTDAYQCKFGPPKE